jgi:hypothetical protein
METQTSEQAPPAQSPAPSLEDRISNILSPQRLEQPKPQEIPQEATETPEQSDEPAPEEASAPAEPTEAEWEEIDYEGEKYKLPAKLKDAVLRQQDYTKKTQEVAEQKRLYEQSLQNAKLWQLEQQFSQSVAPEFQSLSQLDAVLKQYDSLDWRSMSTDDIVRTRMDMDRVKEQRTEAQKAIELKRAQFQQQVGAAQQELVKKGHETLSKMIPGWNETLAKDVLKYAMDDGYTKAEVDSILDPRNVKTLWKAMQYDKLQQSAKAKVKEVKSVKTTPTQPMDTRTKDYLNFRKALQKAPRGSEQHKALLQDRVASLFGGK